MVKLKMDIVGRRVTSEKNRADALLRGERDGHKWKHVVPISVPKDLDNLLFQVLYD
jgi:hypothetical protein